METATILKLLGQVRIFEDFGPGDLEDFLAQTAGSSYAAGTEIFAEGEAGRHMHIILSGKVEVFRKSGGRSVSLVKLGPGETFGEMSLVLDANVGRTASIRAIERTATLKIDYDNLAHIPGVASKLYRNISRTLATRLRISTDLVVFQAQYGADVLPSSTLGKPRRKPAALNAEG
ncbi:MAG: cyclic nucleotide-binding domain-containing protein [Rhodocyclaceae bacterium]|nr:cyclic nucleotide-binding domain-containing protein [Rhodocyclaceae bacterium]